jgi:hypothetical protein
MKCGGWVDAGPADGKVAMSGKFFPSLDNGWPYEREWVLSQSAGAKL